MVGFEIPELLGAGGGERGGGAFSGGHNNQPLEDIDSWSIQFHYRPQAPSCRAQI